MGGVSEGTYLCFGSRVVRLSYERLGILCLRVTFF